MTDWFSSDWHLGHHNIIKYSGRPFKDVEEMNEALIANHNRFVKPEDNFYFIGDFAFCTPEQAQKYLDRMNGTKHFIYGNHDKGNKHLKGWASVSPYKEIYCEDEGEKHFVVLCHYSFRVWNKSHHGAYNFYGHSHGSLPTICNRATDVGVDCWDYHPVSFAELRKYLKKYPSMGKVDHHGE